MYKFRSLLIVLICLLFFSSCIFKKKGKGSEVSTSTGWGYNDPDNGGFEVAVGAEQKTGPGLILIEGGALRWVRCNRMLCLTGTINQEQSQFHRFIWMRLRLRTLITVNIFSG